jgi:hypothetical protein
LETLPDGTDAWLLHKNCNHVRRIIQSSGLDDLVQEIRSTLGSIESILGDEIKMVYDQVKTVTDRMGEEDVGNVILISKLDWDEKAEENQYEQMQGWPDRDGDHGSES